MARGETSRWRRAALVGGLAAAILPSASLGQAGSIGGTVTFWGESGGVHAIQVGAHLDMADPPVAADDPGTPGGPYSLTGLVDGDYYLSAYLDRDDSGGPADPDEPHVWYDADFDGLADTVTVSSGGAVTGTDISLGFIYVDADATGANNGTSWSDAYTSLSFGLLAAIPGLEVWVAEGSYKPGLTRGETFTLKNGVGVYGGFQGGELLRSGRDPDAHQTILSGDIGTAGVATDNSYHVVSAPPGANHTVVLDGFTITAGNADGTDPADRGGGLYSPDGATVVNVVFLSNSASGHGGGMFSAGPSWISNCGFLGNTAGAGGGLWTGCGGQLVNSTFSGNSALNLFSESGGAIYMDLYGTVSPLTTVSNISVSGNHTASQDLVAIVSGLQAECPNILFNPPEYSVLSHSAFSGNTHEYPHRVNYQVWWVGASQDNMINGWRGFCGGPCPVDQTGDPQFLDPDGADNILGTLDDDLQLEYSSAAIDAGDNSLIPEDWADLDGDLDRTERIPLDRALQPRLVDVLGVADTGSGTPPIIDIGAYEKPQESLADLMIHKENHFADLAPGQEVAYSVDAANLGPTDVIGATVADTLPELLKDCVWSCTGTGGAHCTSGPFEGDLDDTANIPVGGIAEYVASCVVAPAAEAEEPVVNTATLAAPLDYWDAATGNNSSTDSDPVLRLGGCHTYPDHRTLDGAIITIDTTIGACQTLTVSNTELGGTAKVEFIAGEWIALANGTRIANHQFTAEIDPGLTP